MGFLNELAEKGKKVISNLDKAKVTYSRSAINLCQKSNDQRNIKSHIGKLYCLPLFDKDLRVVYPIRNYFQLSVMVENPNDTTGEKPYTYAARTLLNESNFEVQLTTEELEILNEAHRLAGELAATYDSGQLYTYNAYVAKVFIEKLVTSSGNLFEIEAGNIEPKLVIHRGQGFLKSIQDVIQYQMDKKNEKWYEALLPNGTSMMIVDTKLVNSGKKYEISSQLDIDYPSQLIVSTEDYERFSKETDLRKEFIDVTRFDKEYYKTLCNEIRETIEIRRGNALKTLDEEGLTPPSTVASTGLETTTTAVENSQNEMLSSLVSEGYPEDKVRDLLKANIPVDTIKQLLAAEKK